MKILIAADGSPYNRSVLEQFSANPFSANTEVRIVSAYKKTSPMTATESMGVLREYDAELNSDAFKAAEKAAEDAANMVRRANIGFTVMTAVLDGSPMRVILNEAETFGADLIVVGASGHGFVEQFLLGSVSRDVALHAKCSVEIIRKKG